MQPAGSHRHWTPFRSQAVQGCPRIQSHHFHQLRAQPVTLPEPSWGTVIHAQEDGRTRKLLQEDNNHSSALGFWFFPVTCVQSVDPPELSSKGTNWLRPRVAEQDNRQMQEKTSSNSFRSF